MPTKDEVSIRYKVKSHDDRLWANEQLPGTVKLDGGAKPVSIQLDRVKENGTYQLMAEVLSSNGTVLGRQDIPFSIAAKITTVPDIALLGVNTHFDQGKGDPEKLLSIMQDAGFGRIRDGYHWPEKDLNKYIDVALKKGIEPFVILHIPTKDENGFALGTDEHAASYAKKSKEIVAKLKGKVKYFEIGNEFNGGFNNPDRLDATYYYKLLKAVYPAIKEANPEAVVVGGSMILADYGWAEKLLESGGAKLMDVFSFHPYMNSDPVGGGFVESIRKMKEVLKRGGFDGPVWATEMGWHNSSLATGVSEMTSASYMVQTYVLAMANQGYIDQIYYYDLANDGTSPMDQEQNFGLVRADEVHSAKLGYVSFAAYAKLLGNAVFEKSYKLDDGLHMYRFTSKSDKKDILVAWSSDGPKPVGLKLGKGNINVIDVMGNSIEAVKTGGAIHTTLSMEPVYFEGDLADDIELEEPAFRLEKNAWTAVPGNTMTVSIQRSSSGSKLSGEYDVKLPEGWKLLSGKTFGKSKRDELTIQIPDELKRKTYGIEIDAVNDKGQRLTQLRLDAGKADPFVVNVSPFPTDTKDWSKWELAVGLTNNNYSKVIEGGTVTIMGPSPWVDGVDYKFPELKPGEMHTVHLPLATTDMTVPEKEQVIPVSKGKKATADSEETGKNNLAYKAIDGEDRTRWAANNSDEGHWLKVDLENVYDLMGTEVKWETDGNAYRYKIEVSTDDANWTTVADKTDTTEKAQTVRDTFDAKARYVRITSTKLDPGRWASIWEFKIYDKANPMPEKKAPSDQVTLKIQPGNDKGVSLEKPVTFLAAAYANQPVVVDGNLTAEEWEGAMQVDVENLSDQFMKDWKGLSDLSMKLKTKWDAEYLYLAVYVMDDRHVQPFHGSSTWQADGIQFATDPSRAYAPGSGGWNEIGCAWNSEDKSVQKYRWNAIPGKTAGDFNELKCAVQRVLNMSTQYEAAIPWSEILTDAGALKPGLDIGFSLLANDNDGTGRRGFIPYMGGIGLGKDPKAYGDLVLVDPEGKFVKMETSAAPAETPASDDSGLLQNRSMQMIAAAIITILAAAAVVYKRRKTSI